MKYLAQSLAQLLEDYFCNSIVRNPEASVRPVLIGPPVDALEEVFNYLTSKGTSEWHINLKDSMLEVVVLFVHNSQPRVLAPSSIAILSQECGWDYAVTARNSRPLVVMLVAPSAWDNRPESLANTTETLGTSRLDTSAKWLRDLPWKPLLKSIAENTGLSEKETRHILSRSVSRAQELEPVVRNRIPWEIANRLLEPVTLAGSISMRQHVAALVGFAFPTEDTTLEEAEVPVQRLAKFFDKLGLAEGINRLSSTNTAATLSLGDSLQALSEHISMHALSGPGFARAPFWFYRPGEPIASWWQSLSADVMTQMLDEVEESKPVRIELRCENALNLLDKLEGEPWITSNTVSLRASAADGTTIPAASFSRKSGITIEPLLSVPGDALACIDLTPAEHSKPMRYYADSPGFTTGSLDVLVLDGFGCKGSARVPDASRNRPPTYSRAQRIWRQEILMRRSGAIDLSIYHSTDIAFVQVGTGNNTSPLRKPTRPGEFVETFVVEVENNDQVAVILEDAVGSTLAEWTVTFLVQENQELARTHFEALILAHQRASGVPVASPLESPLQVVESSYLSSADSWKAVLACWSEPIASVRPIDWSNPQLGDLIPPVDPRLPCSPPTALLEAREALRSYFVGTKRTISEIPLGNPLLAALAETYVRAYLEWLESGSEDASWFDCIAVHASYWNAQAGHLSSTPDPLAILLSPLHPLRIGWHSVAQQQLTNALRRQCPAAGLLDPTSVPDIGVWNLSQGDESPLPRVFLGMSLDNPYWSVLWTSSPQIQLEHARAVLERLTELGLEPRGVAGGFTSLQSRDSLNEVSKLLPGRATLRVGVISGSESSSASAAGVMEWCIEQFDSDLPAGTGPFGVEVYDMRKNTRPSAEQIAALSERTKERVKWFLVQDVPATAPLDLIILDQLETGAPGTQESAARSPLSPGALYRIRVKEDLQNSTRIRESRIGKKAAKGTGLEGLMLEAVVAFEEFAATKAHVSQRQIQPNLEAIGSRLSQATYLAVTSSQVDPAYIIRGSMTQQGYLWDYELPGALGGAEESSGYYLIAKPLPAMSAAILKSAQLVAATPPSVEELLSEISHRGIPILKRMATGGAQSRGELGMLLAVRLLQDAFRPSAAGTRVRLPVCSGHCIHLILPVDPYEKPLSRLRKAILSGTSNQRPDLLVCAIELPKATSTIQLRITPVEVKFRGEGQMADTELAEALGQAANLGRLLHLLWEAEPLNDLWGTCSRALLGQWLDYGFRIYADERIHGRDAEEWTRIHERVIQDVLSGHAVVNVNVHGKLLAFDRSAHSAVVDIDGNLEDDTVIVSPAAAEALLAGHSMLTTDLDAMIDRLALSFSACSGLNGVGVEVTNSKLNIDAQTQSDMNVEVTKQPPMPNPSTSMGTSVQRIDASPSGSYEHLKTVMSVITNVSPEVRERVRYAFEGFIGNEAAIKRLTNDLLRALMESPPHLPKNYLFTGQPSTGKTELARRVAKALDLPFVRLDGRGVTSRERLLELVNGELRQQGLHATQVGQQASMPVLDYPPLVIFIDEVHLVSRVIQESLLTVLEAADRTVTLNSQVARMEKTTFLFATTRASDVDSAFRSRCTEVQLREYKVEEVAEIVRRRFPRDWPWDVYLKLALLGKSVPRIALDLARELETEIAVSEHPERALAEHLDEVRKAMEIDPLGLSHLDIRYLSILEREKRPIGEQPLLNLLGTVDKDRVIDETEPFLIRLGFIRLGSRGREITSDGAKYILAKRRSGDLLS